MHNGLRFRSAAWPSGPAGSRPNPARTQPGAGEARRGRVCARCCGLGISKGCRAHKHLARDRTTMAGQTFGERATLPRLPMRDRPPQPALRKSMARKRNTPAARTHWPRAKSCGTAPENFFCRHPFFVARQVHGTSPNGSAPPRNPAPPFPDARSGVSPYDDLPRSSICCRCDDLGRPSCTRIAKMHATAPGTAPRKAPTFLSLEAHNPPGGLQRQAGGELPAERAAQVVSAAPALPLAQRPNKPRSRFLRPKTAMKGRFCLALLVKIRQILRSSPAGTPRSWRCSRPNRSTRSTRRRSTGTP